MIFDVNLKSQIKNPWGSRYIGTKAQNVSNFLGGLPVLGESIEKSGQKVMNALSQIGGFINPALGAASKFINVPVTELGDFYKVGYKTNGDSVPNKKNPSNGNLY